MIIRQDKRFLLSLIVASLVAKNNFIFDETQNQYFVKYHD
jgi:hypothetical protein